MKLIALTFLSLAISISAKAEFRSSSLRYISVYDFSNKINQIFGAISATPDANYYKSACNGDLISFGFSNPVNGDAQSDNPTTATTTAISQCMTNLMQATQTVITKPELTADLRISYLVNLLPPELIEKYVRTNPAWLTTLSYPVNIEEKKLMVYFLTEEILGVDSTIVSFGNITDVDQFRKYILDAVQYSGTPLDTVSRILQILVIRDEFLTY